MPPEVSSTAQSSSAANHLVQSGSAKTSSTIPQAVVWGYGGIGPAQCPLAILIDYLGDEERVRALQQYFKFKVVARFPANG